MCRTLTGSSLLPSRCFKTLHLCSLTSLFLSLLATSSPFLPSSYLRCWKIQGRVRPISFLSLYECLLPCLQIITGFPHSKGFLPSTMFSLSAGVGEIIYVTVKLLSIHSLFNQALPLDLFWSHGPGSQEADGLWGYPAQKRLHMWEFSWVLEAWYMPSLIDPFVQIEEDQTCLSPYENVSTWSRFGQWDWPKMQKELGFRREWSKNIGAVRDCLQQQGEVGVSSWMLMHPSEWCSWGQFSPDSSLGKTLALFPASQLHWLSSGFSVWFSFLTVLSHPVFSQYTLFCWSWPELVWILCHQEPWLIKKPWPSSPCKGLFSAASSLNSL